MPREVTHGRRRLRAWLESRGGGYAEAFADLKRDARGGQSGACRFRGAGRGGRRGRVLSAGDGRLAMIRVQTPGFRSGRGDRRGCMRGRSDIGAVVSFVGLVRGESHGETLTQHDARAFSGDDGARA